MRRILLAAPMTLDMLEFERDVLVEEILERTKLLFASVDANLNKFGIVDSADPADAVASDLRPFVVTVNSADPGTIDVRGGTVVFSSGEILLLNEISTRIPVVGGIGTKSVVYLYFDEQELYPKLTRHDTLPNTRLDYLDSAADYIRVSTLTDFASLSSAELERVIPLAQVTVQAVASGAGTISELFVDMSRDNLATNRPWFSAVDIEHRSYTGSGVVTSNNPHGLSLNDISATGEATLFQLHLDHGMIVSKDKDVPKVPGKLCSEEILPGAIEVDTTGSVTGVMGAYYFFTGKFPTQIIRCSDPDNFYDYAPVHVTRKNLVFLLPDDEYVPGNSILIDYMTTSAAEPPTETPLTRLTFGSIDSRETVIADGRTVSTIFNTEYTFEDAGPIPQDYTVYLDGDGDFQRYPHTVLCYKKLTAIGSTLQQFDTSLAGPGRVKVALSNAIASATLSVEIQITGTDAEGTIITETVSFGSSWADNAAGNCVESSDQFVVTENTFETLTNFIVVTNTDSGPDASIAMYGDVTPLRTEALADILPIVKVTWDGLQVCDIEDIRPINTTMHLPRVTKHAAAGAPLSETTLIYWPGYMFNFWVEDFDKPKFITTRWTDDSTAVTLSPSESEMQRIFEGSDIGDRYISKPVAVRPHTSGPTALRILPIEPDRDFNMWVRFFDGSGAWSDWSNISALLGPNYTIDLTTAASPLVKWQVQIEGQCKGFFAVYVTDGAGASPIMVFDVGTFDNGAFE